MKQTAMDWLYTEIERLTTRAGIHMSWAMMDDLLKQAKEMERWQIKGAYNDGAFDTFAKGYKGMHEYYNETYGGENEI
jgi:hypothetical protein